LWIYALAYQDENQDKHNFLLRLCQHCGNAPCVKVCPVRARHKRENDGLVLTDYDLCIGCRYCMVTCPYGVNYFQWDEPTTKNYYHPKLTDYRGRWVIGNPPKGVMGKCTFCPDRQDDGRGNVVCELVCTHNVLHFGDMNDPNSRPNRYLLEKMKEKGNVSTFRLLENQGTKPSIIYIGQQPTRAARPVEGPVSYTDWGLVEERLPLLAGPEPWFMKAFGGGQ
ncbi:MAG: 4Fe-4S dicluster domain-containing protein, partial [Chloroflexi bacterium]|nr:4Fe-4S dicluster domain-containing protein [Chloroflexota bacterium]